MKAHMSQGSWAGMPGKHLVSLYFVKHLVSLYLSHSFHLLTQSDSLQPTEGETTEVTSSLLEMVI